MVPVNLLSRHFVTMCLLFATGFGFAQTATVPPKPLGRIELLALRIDGVSDDRLVKLLQQRGITFQPDEGYHRMLQDAGATTDLLSAFDAAKITPAAGGIGSGGQDSAAREAAVLEHMDRGAQLDRNRFHPREAEPEYRASVDADPTSAFPQLVLGAVLARLDQRDQAKREFREAVRLQPDMAEAHVGLAGMLFLKKGNRQEAFREFGRALALAPDDARIRRIYMRLLLFDGKGPEAEEQRRIADRIGPAEILTRIHLEGSEEQAKLIFKVNPKVPPEAKKNRVQGKVAMEVLIGEDGSVIDLEVISGDPVLAKAATDAVWQWRFQPAVFNDRAVQVETDVDVNFSLAE